MNPIPAVPTADVASAAQAATPHLRPSAHFTAQDTWLNDPNGLLHHAGVYHLFFQNNSEGNIWGPMSWGHATSTDLVTWSEHDVAIAHTPEENVFSGSAVADVRNTAGFAGPGETALVAVYTSAYTSASRRPGVQAQSLAYSLDGGVDVDPVRRQPRARHRVLGLPRPEGVLARRRRGPLDHGRGRGPGSPGRHLQLAEPPRLDPGVALRARPCRRGDVGVP